MASPETLYLFGDQTFDVRPHTRALLNASGSNATLQNFLDRTYHALRSISFDEARGGVSEWPLFTSVEDILLWNPSPTSAPCVPWEMALTCMYQLGTFIIKHTNADYPTAATGSILALCTGSLAAVTISSCRSLSELVPKAVQAVVAAFRIGICVSNVASRFGSEPGEPWFAMIAGPSAARSVQSFIDSTDLPAPYRPYISAYTPSGVAVSGPPASLRQLLATLDQATLRSKYMPVYAPYHAPHLYTASDVDSMLQHVEQDLAINTATQPIAVIASNGQLVQGENFRGLLQEAVENILLRPIHWPNILERLTMLWQERLTTTWQTHGSVDNLRIDVYGSRADPLIRSALNLSSAKNHRSRFEHSTISDEQSKKPKIAIVGMSGRFPGGANSCDEFWDILEQGMDVHKHVPASRWSTAHVDPTGTQKNTSATPYGCWLDDAASFDARFFNISPREAPQIDPAQRLALMTAYEALEQAGVVPDATPSTRRDRVGVFYGVTSNDWMETNSAQSIDTYFIPGGNRAFIPGRINYFFKFSGPSYATDTACSSSLAAIHTAINSLWQRDIDTAIAGGTNVLTNPDFTSGLDRGHFLSRTGNCKTFDDGADGYCRGEAIGTVILKRLDDAIAEKDPILGVILGAYTNHSAQAESITRPHTGAQRAIFSKILNSSNVDSETVGYVEMHGTGTQAGDATEMSSTLQVFAPSDKPPRKSAVYIGSAKANIGHGEAASGVSALCKVLLMLKHKTIPPHVGIKTKINHKFPSDLFERNVHIAKRPVEWQAQGDTPRRAFVNNFSAAGGNSALLLEEAPTLEKGELAGPQCDGLIAISAKSSTALRGNLQALRQFLLSSGRTASLPKLSYTTTARRMHHRHRVMLLGNTSEDLVVQLDGAIEQGIGSTVPKHKVLNPLFAFTGQGAQFPGMGRQMMETFSLFRTELEKLDALGCMLGFPSIMPVYHAKLDQSLEDFLPVQVQMASVSMQIALAKLWASWNIRPQAVVGHSLGEYAALNVARVLCDADTLYLVGTRATLLQDLCTKNTHCMLVVRANEDKIRAVLGKVDCPIACTNSPIETVLAGPSEEISHAAQILEASGVKTTKLDIPYAFHSSQVEPILERFQEAAKKVRFSKPIYPVLCPLDGSIVSDDTKFDATYLGRHCREPVNMLEALRAARAQGLVSEEAVLLEVGPHPAVAGMVKATLGPQVKAISAMSRKGSRSVLIDALKVLYQAGADIDWTTYHKDFPGSQQLLTGLPTYCWDLKPYWIQYVNDWSLRKGEAAVHTVPQPLPLLTDPAILESTTIHRIVSQKSSPNGVQESICVEADIARPDMNPLVQGHMVDGVPLCTPSVYADIALTLGRWLAGKRNHDLKDVDVSDMSIFKALIARKTGPQPLLTRAEIDWSINEARLSFISFDGKGKEQEHAKCVVRFTDASLLVNKLKDQASSIKASMKQLRDGVGSDTTARFNRAMVYRMIRPLAQFHDDYRAIDEVILDSSTLEASASVSFGGVRKDGTFALHPAIIDAFTQSCGFAMNCNDHTDLDKDVYMNHGWGSFQVFEPVHFDRPYTSYTKMTKSKKDGIWNGDVIIFDKDTIVAAFQQIEIQCVPRRVLGVILSLEAGTKKKRIDLPVLEAPVKITPHKQEPVSPRDSVISTALHIISEESGVAVQDLTDSTAFADMGVDSLLGLSIGARFREDLELDLNFDAMFINQPTVGDMKRFLLSALPTITVAETNVPVQRTTVVPRQHHETVQAPLPPRAGAGTSAIVQRIFDIISEESGIDASELTNDTHFSDTGIDSLLGLVIASRLREELDLDIPTDSLFVECTTIGELTKRITPSAQTSSSASASDGTMTPGSSSSSDISDSSGTVSPASSSDTEDSDDGYCWPVTVPRATSLILQGNLKTASRMLFLFPDGCGAASSYAQIPALSADTCVVGLTCPLLKESRLLRRVKLDDLINNGYIAEIRRRQPQGPYHLGGWSAGGILAYRATQILQASGSQVNSLSLIDSPAPTNGLDRLPPHFYKYCESLHLFGHKAGTSSIASKSPDWLIPHFNATIDVLHNYHATPYSHPASHPPIKVGLLWAATSIADNPNLPKLAPHPDDTEGMKFLLARRTDFGGNGWEKLFGENVNIRIEKAESAHHFSMMREPYSQKLGTFLRSALSA